MNESNSFVLACDDSHEAILIDLGDEDPSIMDYLAEHRLNLTTIFITHDHFDHTGGLNGELARRATVLSGRGSVGAGQRRKVCHGDTVAVGRLEGRVLATPGHTPDSLSLVFPGHVFTGDALFAGSVGGTSSPECARQELEVVRKHILSLPDDYEVHTGHGPSSTVGIERCYNPFFV